MDVCGNHDDLLVSKCTFKEANLTNLPKDELERMAGQVLQARVQRLAGQQLDISSDLLSTHRTPGKGNNEKLSCCARISAAQGTCIL